MPTDEIGLTIPDEATRELVVKLLRQQEQREAEEREAIRRAVSETGLPVPDTILCQLFRMPQHYAIEILRWHPGFAFASRCNSYTASFSLLELSFADLLSAISAFEQQVLAEGSTLFYRRNSETLEAFTRKVQKELLAATTAVVSVVEHSRRLQGLVQHTNFGEKLRECFEDDSLHEFVVGLRVLLHHLEIVHAGWMLHRNMIEGTESAGFVLTTNEVRFAIERNAKSFTKKSIAQIMRFVDDAPRHIDLRKIFEDYWQRANKFNRWFAAELESASYVALRDYERCVRAIHNNSSRTAWRALLGNWLHNWKTPPDPHEHLRRFLTPEQYSEVYKLPRNSREQIDLVIEYLDKDHAADDELRGLAYELFVRSGAANSN